MKRCTSDAADAEVIFEAVIRPTMRFVAIKTVDQPAALMLQKTRNKLVRQGTILTNGLRGYLAEIGIISAKGPEGVKAVIETLHGAQDKLREPARLALPGLVDQPRPIDAAVDRRETRIVAWHRASDVSRRLATIPSIGPITASAIAAAVPGGMLFRYGRQLVLRTWVWMTLS